MFSRHTLGLGRGETADRMSFIERIADHWEHGVTPDELPDWMNDTATAWEFVEAMRWPEGPICPRCGDRRTSFLTPRAGTRPTRTGKRTVRRVWKCGACRQQFSALIGTRFEDSRIPLDRWLFCLHITAMSGGDYTIGEFTELHGLSYVTVNKMMRAARALRRVCEQKTRASELRIGGYMLNMMLFPDEPHGA